MSSAQNDPCLRAFLDATTEEEAEPALEALLTGEADTLNRLTVTRHLGRTRWMTDHIDDVLADLRVRLTQKLWSLRSGVGEPVENFRAYATTAAKRACYSFLRSQFPERTRLRNRVRYAVTHHPDMSLEEDVTGTWRCRSTVTRIAPRTGSTQALIDGPQRHALEHSLDLRASLQALVRSILQTCDQPVEFDRLVDAIAVMLGLPDQPAVSHDPGLQERVADPAEPISTLMEQRASLDEVWNEVLALPLRQRTALLLNLRDPYDGAAIDETRFAAALEITEAELAVLWKDLPLDDLAIADRLGATRQQVINLRKSARARLARGLGRSRS
jgi:DNA-directed RNA polymerase specialized sigma24 family protein